MIATFQLNHGCETSAVLHHGSFIRFGCLQFAFSIIDYQENGDHQEQPSSDTHNAVDEEADDVTEKVKKESKDVEAWKIFRKKWADAGGGKHYFSATAQFIAFLSSKVIYGKRNRSMPYTDCIFDVFDPKIINFRWEKPRGFFYQILRVSLTSQVQSLVVG